MRLAPREDQLPATPIDGFNGITAWCERVFSDVDHRTAIEIRESATSEGCIFWCDFSAEVIAAGRACQLSKKDEVDHCSFFASRPRFLASSQLMRSCDHSTSPLHPFRISSSRISVPMFWLPVME